MKGGAPPLQGIFVAGVVSGVRSPKTSRSRFLEVVDLSYVAKGTSPVWLD